VCLRSTRYYQQHGDSVISDHQRRQRDALKNWNERVLESDKRRAQQLYPAAPNPTVAYNVMKWREQQLAREERRAGKKQQATD
jgi:hypothetical protein